MSHHVQKIATAALLHDIGKFWSRTGDKPPFDQQEKEHFNTYEHALWSAHFVEQHIKDAEMASWVRDHHTPTRSKEAAIISLADWLSSGERHQDEDIERDKPQAAALVNILSQISTRENQTPDQASSYFPLTAHAKFDGAFMPKAEPDAGNKYFPLWSDFLTALKSLPDLSSPETPHATWLSLMKRYCSRIPAATPTRIRGYVPDISLYDHCRISAAIASCLAANDMTAENAAQLRDALAHIADNPNNQQLDQPLLRLVCGNLSGIQDFLYTIPRKGAAKTLRARSFTLQLF